jgi:hypothetical protein
MIADCTAAPNSESIPIVTAYVVFVPSNRNNIIFKDIFKNTIMDLKSWDKAQPNDSLCESTPFERVEINRGNGLTALGVALMRLRVESPEKTRRIDVEYHSSPSSHQYNMQDSVMGSSCLMPQNILLSPLHRDADDSSVTDCSIPPFVYKKYVKRSISAMSLEGQDIMEKSESFAEKGDSNEIIRTQSPPHKRSRRYHRRNSVVIPEGTSKLLQSLILSSGDGSLEKKQRTMRPSWLLLGIPPVPFHEKETCPSAVGDTVTDTAFNSAG